MSAWDDPAVRSGKSHHRCNPYWSREEATSYQSQWLPPLSNETSMIDIIELNVPFNGNIKKRHTQSRFFFSLYFVYFSSAVDHPSTTAAVSDLTTMTTSGWNVFHLSKILKLITGYQWALNGYVMQAWLKSFKTHTNNQLKMIYSWQLANDSFFHIVGKQNLNREVKQGQLLRSCRIMHEWAFPLF